MHHDDSKSNNNNNNNNSSSLPKRSTGSFHTPTDLQRQRDHDTNNNHDDEETIDDLHETITNLKESVMTHANSSAETMEHFTTLQNAYDTVLKEHVHLQEQMDDAVELLKYLKEEKSNYQEQIVEMQSEMEEVRGANEGSVVSMTMKNLTREKMDLEQSLHDARGRGEKATKQIATLDCENSELLIKIDSLEKVKEAYDLQTRQQLESKTKLSNLAKERAELLDKVRTLEKESTIMHGEKMRGKDDYETRLQKMTKEWDNDKASIAKLQEERDNLLHEQNATKGQLTTLKGDMHNKYQTQGNEIETLNAKLANSLSHIAQLQRERRDSQTNKSNSLMEMNAKFVQLESVNRDMLQEKEDMKLYVTKMEETLVEKDEKLEIAEGEFHTEKEEMVRVLSLLQEQVEEQEELQEHLQSSRQQQEALQEELWSYQQQQQQQEKEKRENESLLLEKNESLKCKVQELQDQLEEQPEYPAQLEREMQERLAKRIAAQLSESKIAMEAQIREELEAEYNTQQQEEAASELEEQLRTQLSQVKSERERWESEQGEIQRKVMNSQQQFEKVREGFKKKIEKEKLKSRDLEQANEGQQVVIEKMSEEYQGVMAQLEELQDQMVSDRHSSNQQSRQEWKEDKASLLHHHQVQLEELSQREEQYATQIHQLQNEINELLNEQVTHENEYNQWQDEKTLLVERHAEEKVDLEQLNFEIAEYLQKIEACEATIDSLQQELNDNEDTRVKYSVLQIEQKELKKEFENRVEQNENLMRQMEQLNTENGEFQQQILTLEQKINDVSTNLSSTQEERNKLQDSLQETSELCLQMESKLSSHKREKEQLLEECQGKIAHLEEMLAQTEGASEAAGLAMTEKEKAITDMTAMDSMHQEVLAGLQSRITDSLSQVSKLISEKASLATKFESGMSDLSIMKENAEAQTNKITQLESSIESLSTERDAANARVADLVSGNESAEQVLSSLKSDKNELASNADESKKTTIRLDAEKAEAIAKASSMEDTINELQDKAKSQAADLNASKSEINDLVAQIEAINQQQTKAEPNSNANPLDIEKEGANSNSTDQNNPANEDPETKVQALQSVIDELKETIAQITTENTAISAQNISALPQSSEASADDLMKDLVEVNNNVQRLKEDHQQKLQKLNTELRDLRDNNIILEEGLQDVQVEKEDLELENEELASKLTDLTTQAKKMLLNNESLEEAIQDQQIEYEDRIAELEGQFAETCEDNDMTTLHQKHKAALETIVKLKKDIGMTVQDTSGDQLQRVEEENLELREVVDHLSSENNAAKEIKFIVLELRAKNTEISESLRVSQEQNNAAADIIENLKTDNEHLRKDLAMTSVKSTANMLTAEAHDDRAMPFEYGADESTKMSEMEAELQHYRAMVSKMTSDRNVFNHQLSELMDMPAYPALENAFQATVNEGALIPLESNNNIRDHLNDAVINQGMMVVTTDTAEASPYAPQSTQLHHPVEEQMQNLTIENGQLAQRLGNAVADKEFAMTTLSKLGAKMEDLMERNKLLSNLANMKSQHASRGASYYSGGQSMKSNHEEYKLKHEGRGRDPDASGEVENASANSSYGDMETSNYPAPSDDPSAYSDMGSTILSYEPSKRLEPEPSSYVEGIAQDNGLGRRNAGGREGNARLVSDPNEALSENVSSASDPRLVKVPGGEYFGQLNKGGQKHGNGKMKYDNGNEYDGQWKNNKRDGKGTTKYTPSGNVYTGTWKTGKRHGFGVFHINKTGDVYRGNWAHGLKSGAGVYEYADGELDVSFYQEDIRAGEGVRWSASRHQASRLVDGQLVGEEGGMLVEAAMKLTKHLGFVV